MRASIEDAGRPNDAAIAKNREEGVEGGRVIHLKHVQQ